MLISANRATEGTVAQSALVVALNGAQGREQLMTPAQVTASTDEILKVTVANASKVMTFLTERFGRNGLDGKGQQLQIVAHASDPMMPGPMSNAYWSPESNRMYVGDGDGRTFKPFGYSLDIIAHEAGHAILESEVKMGFDGEEGALHESFGDVLGALVDPDDWKIAEDIVLSPSMKNSGVRDMSRPARFTHFSQVKSHNREPHDLADIPNLAAFIVAEKIGRNDMGDIWYQGFTENLPNNAKFSDAAVATINAAEQIYGKTSTQALAVADAWKSVGVLAAPKQTNHLAA